MRFVRWESRREELHCLLEGFWYEPFERTETINTYRQKSVKSITVDTQMLIHWLTRGISSTLVYRCESHEIRGTV